MSNPGFPNISFVFSVALGGAVGSVTRFLAGHYMAAWLGSSFPWATLAVNVVGSLWLGFIATLALGKPGMIDPWTRLLLTTGFAGGFTTFSTFAYETLALYERGDIMMALGNIGLNLIVGLVAVVLGALIARAI
jgi:CrcB protein